MRPTLTEPEWTELRRGMDPCPGCQRTDWCSVAELPETGERVHACKRDEDPTDTNSWFSYAVYLASGERLPGTLLDYRLGRAAERGADFTPPPRKRKPKPPPVASTEDLDVVYRWLLARLPATGDDLARAELESRGLDPAAYGAMPSTRARRNDVAAAAVREHGEDLLATVPGFYRDAESGRWRLAGMSGVLIPCRDHLGRVVALKIRTHNEDRDRAAERGDRIPKMSSLSSASRGGPKATPVAHVPLHRDQRRDRIRITEGELKADEATMRSGLLTVGAPGVSAWRGAIDTIRALVDPGATVVLAYDANAADEGSVAAALCFAAAGILDAGFRLAVETWSPGRSADGYPTKGIDDVLRVRGPVVTLEAAAACDYVRGVGRAARIPRIPELRAADPMRPDELHAAAAPSIYRFAGGMTWLLDEDGEDRSPVANFEPHVIEEVSVHDADALAGDGVVSRRYIVEIRAGRPPWRRVELSAEEYRGERHDWLRKLPGNLTVSDGKRATRDHVVGAMRALGYTSATRQTAQYDHTGWVEHGGSHIYVGPRVSIGPHGPVDDVVLSEEKAGLELDGLDLRPTAGKPDPADAWALLGAVETVAAVTALGWTFRSLIGRQSAPLWIAGRQQSGKTFLAMTLLGFVGHRRLTTGGTSDGASLAGVANLMDTRRHLPTFVDDVWKVGQRSRQDRAALADAIMRAQYDGTFAAKANRDGSLRRDGKRARGSLIVTAETPPPNDGPGGASLRSRTLVINARPGMIQCRGRGSLDEIQDQLRVTGRLAAVGASFLQWVAADRKRIAAEALTWPKVWLATLGHSSPDLRSAMAVADAAFGLELLIRWTEHVGGTVPDDATVAIAEALRASAHDSAESQAEASPAESFRRILASALAAGAMRFNGQDDSELRSDAMRSCGIGRCGDQTDTVHGHVIHHEDHGRVLFFSNWDVIEGILSEHAHRTQRALPSTGRALRAMLEEAGLIVSSQGRGTLRVQFAGRRWRGVAVRWPVQDADDGAD